MCCDVRTSYIVHGLANSNCHYSLNCHCTKPQHTCSIYYMYMYTSSHIHACTLVWTIEFPFSCLHVYMHHAQFPRLPLSPAPGTTPLVSAPPALNARPSLPFQRRISTLNPAPRQIPFPAPRQIPFQVQVLITPATATLLFKLEVL